MNVYLVEILLFFPLDFDNKHEKFMSSGMLKTLKLEHLKDLWDLDFWNFHDCPLARSLIIISSSLKNADQLLVAVSLGNCAGPAGNVVLHNCLFIFKAMVGEECVGAIVCKLDMHKKMFRRGYIAMLAVDSKYRRNGIGKENITSLKECMSCFQFCFLKQKT